MPAQTLLIGKRAAEHSAQSKRVEIAGKVAYSSFMNGEFLPPQLIYQGKTTRCLPHYDFPPAYSPNHWSNEETMRST